MGIFDNLRNWFISPLLSAISNERQERLSALERAREYRKGIQRPQLKAKLGQYDDNTYINYTTKIVEQSVSMLFGNGVEFDLPGDQENNPVQDYIDNTFAANRKDILLHALATFGAEGGTCYAKLQPGYYGDYARILPIDPAFMTVHTDPEDKEMVTQYVIEFVARDVRGKLVKRKQTHTREYNMDTGETAYWLVEDYQKTEHDTDWVLIGSEPWEYEFPAIVHWQNLPDPANVYGDPDITDDIIMLQDKINANVSNVNKIIRHHAHPKTVGLGFGKDQLGAVGDGPDQFWTVNTQGADIKNLEMQSELIPAMQHIQMLRQAMFETTNSVDLASLKDKIGALTNFGLRVLYSDALNKLNTKQALYGDALLEIIRRLLILNGMADDPGEIVWPEPLMENEQESAEAIRADVEAGFVSVPTASERRGYDWEKEKGRMTEYKQEQEASSDNVGAMILRNFVGNRQA